MQSNTSFTDKSLEGKAAKSEDLWNSYKELAKVVHTYLNGDNPNLMLHELECVLWKHKRNFFAPLQNRPKNAKSREELKKGMAEGITVKGIGHQILSQELYEETIILSDMYDMNEFVALDLLCTAQIQMSFYPGLPRGLVAILLYYDSRKSFVSSLRMLVQARTGVQWSVNIRPEVEKYITAYTDELFDSGLFTRIFDLLKTLDLSKELEMLQQNLALGGPKHRRQVVDLFNDIRVILADIVFTWSAQCGLPKTQTIALIDHLKDATIEEEASGKIDDVNMLLEAALLSAFDLSILHTRDDSEEAIQCLPVISQSFYVQAVLSKFEECRGNWRCRGLEAMASFGMGICLASLKFLPQRQPFESDVEQQDNLIDRAIDLNVFEFFHNVYLENALLYKEEFVLKRIHHLITDFIIYLYPKVRELRIKADEIAKTLQAYTNEGIDPPNNFPNCFEQFMLCISKLYSRDPLNLELSSEYWSPIEVKPTKSGTHKNLPRSASLFKFVKFAGEMLPSVLFVSYMKMLRNLSLNPPSARHCFNMLKQTSGNINNTLSWDHFFLTFSRYYNSLHQEPNAPSDVSYQRRTTFQKGITPREIEGLRAVLGLIQTIADHDDFSRLALCEHPAWTPLNIFLGLISCSIPITLKAELLSSLASLSRSQEIATQMWEYLEASQILVTVPSTSSFQPRGIQTELEEIESHLEEYPLTRAFLKLLDVLTVFGIPRTLGASHRKPGFDPYLNFILNSVFHKFNNRAYKSPVEKWQVAEICLKMFQRFLDTYDPSANDFPVNNKLPDFNPPPGYHLMLHSNTKSEYLSLLLYIIDEGRRHFDTYLPFVCRELLKKCTLIAMNLINRSLSLHDKFFALLPTATAPTVLTNLSKLLLIINPRSGNPDHYINIVKYVGYQDFLPKHTLAAINIITQATQNPIIHSQFLNILIAHEEHEAIKSSFVECLDAVEENTDEGDIATTKTKIITLIQQCLHYSAPNLSHCLLGFDLKRDVSKMQFQLPGVLGFPRSCLHALFTLLKVAHINGKSSTPRLLEAAYKLLFMLVSDADVSEPVLRYLRLDVKFFKNHLDYCAQHMNNGVFELKQMSWLLKTIAIELNIVCNNNQMNHVKQLTNLLVDLPSDHDVLPTESLLFTSKNAAEYDDSYIPKGQQSNFLLQLITQFSVDDEELVAPRWDFFDTNVLESILKQCYLPGTIQLIDVKKLHHTLLSELNAVQGNSAITQRQAILQEIQKVLLHAVAVNNSKTSAAAVGEFVDSWRQVVEVLVTFVPTEVISVQEQQVLNLQILESLLKKITKSNVLPQVADYLSGTILILLVNLRRCAKSEERQKSIIRENTTNPSVLQINSSTLKEIFTLLIEWLMSSGVGHQKLRTNLYTSLVNFLYLITPEISIEMSPAKEDSLYVSRLDSSSRGRKVISYPVMATEIISTMGEKTIEVLCQDCIVGHDVSKMLAMSSFGLLISTSGIVNWVVFMSGRGYLKHIIEGIMKTDEELQKLLEPTSTDLKPLYLFQSKMSFLARVASTRVGSELLLEHKLLSYLSNMNVFDYHPEVSKDIVREEVLEDYTLPANKRYVKMWISVFDVCNAVLTSLGTLNKSAMFQILCFLVNRVNGIEFILRAGNPNLCYLSLKELAAVTSVICRVTNMDLLNLIESETSQNVSSFLYHIQKLMLALLNRFILTDAVVKDLLVNKIEEKHSFKTSDRLLMAMQVVSNLMQYAKNLTTNNGSDTLKVSFMFQPILKDALLAPQHKQSSIYSDQITSLGVIVEHLVTTVKYCLKERHTYNFLVTKIAEVPEMNSIELKNLLNDLPQSSNIYVMREQAATIISDKYRKKKLEMEYCSFIIEHCMYIIWTHLDYYMLRAIPKARNFKMINPNDSISVNDSLASAAEATWKVSTDDISSLKQGLVSIFSDIFTKELIQIVEGSNELDKSLIETLLRKIKRLVQFVPVK